MKKTKIFGKLIVLLLPSLIGSLTASAADPQDEKASSETTVVAIGVGVERQPSWLGAATHKTHPVPYLDITWHDQVELSTTDGLSIDFLHGEHWHGGLVGTLMWGRSSQDLGVLANRINTLHNTLQAGTYIEYAITKSLSAGLRWRHDIQGTGTAYGDVYTELGLPAPGSIEHSIKLDAQAMNGAAMRRFFGVSPETASALGTAPYRPNGGFNSLSATYQIFVPTSQHTGISFAIDWSRLRGAAAQSPLVRNFGSRNQRNVMLAAIMDF
ncbi:MAG: hypothetical protein JWM03_956 [Rhodocyclales bacterium]|nr:hypothetical protein [Rhodocyclales bacterium]